MERPPGDGASDAADGAAVVKDRALGETCDPINAGTPNRTDNCIAGLVCVDGNVGSLCFQRCAADGECGGTACERRPVETGATPIGVCGLKPTECSPVAPPSGCPPQRTCYLAGDVTVCEPTSGDNPPQTSCTYPRDCLPGSTCATGFGAGYCRRVCSGTVLCSGALICQRAIGATYGYCF